MTGFHFLFTILLIPLIASKALATKTFCSVTLNSADEKNVFQKQLAHEDFKYIELVPDSKDPHWFQKACDSKIQCDVLLISGHFGGLFFGQGTSTTLGLQELETQSCQQTCAGILSHPKEVFLMGCNTLATQKKDQRTYSEYLKVLLEDGIPLTFAEEVVSSRYSAQGFTLEKKFSSIFPQAKKLYGFNSTGPLGASAAPRLQRYLEKVGSYGVHLDQMNDKPNTALSDAFRGTNYQETNPTASVGPENRELFCALRAADKEKVQSATQKIFETNQFTLFFDSFAVMAQSPPAIATASGTATANVSPILGDDSKSKLLRKLDVIASTNSEFLTIQHQVIQIKSTFGLITQQQRQLEVQKLLKKSYSQNLDYSKISQICSIIETEKESLNLSEADLLQLRQKSPYTFLLLNCKAPLASAAKAFLLKQIANPKNETELTLALQIMKTRWLPEDKS